MNLDEPILKDDYPVYCGYCYVGDGKVVISPVSGSVAQLKLWLNLKEVRRCDIVGRQNQAEEKKKAFNPNTSMGSQFEKLGLKPSNT